MGLRVITSQTHAPALLSWLGSKLGWRHRLADAFTIALIDPQEDNVAREEDVVVVTALSRFTEHSCEASIAANGTGKASREYVITVFDTVFNKLGKSRLHTFVKSDNAESIALQKRLGFKQEAELADHFGPGTTALLFGITKSMWLAGRWAPRQRAEANER